MSLNMILTLALEQSKYFCGFEFAALPVSMLLQHVSISYTYIFFKYSALGELSLKFLWNYTKLFFFLAPMITHIYIYPRNCSNSHYYYELCVCLPHETICFQGQELSFVYLCGPRSQNSDQTWENLNNCVMKKSTK